jgi:hypothetical protein
MMQIWRGERSATKAIPISEQRRIQNAARTTAERHCWLTPKALSETIAPPNKGLQAY